MPRILFAVLVAFCGLGILGGGAQAHRASDAYLSLTLEDDRIEGRWDIALRDLERAVGLDGDRDGAVTWGELRGKQDEVASYALARLGLSSAGAPCATTTDDQMVEQRDDGAYAVLIFSAACTAPIEALQVDYDLLFDLDRLHRGLLQISHDGQTESAVLSPDARVWIFEAEGSSLWRQATTYLREGVWHIWIGFDHILFLVSLLLPAVLRRETRGCGAQVDRPVFRLARPAARPAPPPSPSPLEGEGTIGWRRYASLPLRRGREREGVRGQPQNFFGRAHAWTARDHLRDVFAEVVKVVTAFTAAHSITLGLATLGWLDWPARIVEPVIAATIVLAALNNLFPVVRRGLWIVAFGFGLIHGVGFAGALGDLGLPDGALVTALLSFNLGVELGQLAIVAVLLPLAFATRRSRLYPMLVLRFGSLAIAALAGLWLVERSFGLALIT